MVSVDYSRNRHTALAMSPMPPFAWLPAKSAQKCSMSNSGAAAYAPPHIINTSANTKLRAMPLPYNTSRFSPVPKLAQIVRIPQSGCRRRIRAPILIRNKASRRLGGKGPGGRR
jgi:hypothetical protein